MRILIIAAALIVLVAGAGWLMTALQPAAQPPETAENALAYLRVQVGSQVQPLIPLRDGGEHIVEQEGGKKNVIHTTATGAVMHFSTCENQNCIEQGEVTLDNRSGRVMGGLIVCLPNEIVLELLTPEEAGHTN